MNKLNKIALTLLPILLISISAVAVFAQSEDCFTQVNEAVANTLSGCDDLAAGQVCYRTSTGIEMLPADVSQITLQSPPVSIAAMQLSLTDESAASLFAFGSLRLSRAAFTWRAFTMADSGRVCTGSERPSGVLIQGPGDVFVDVQVNDTAISFNQTVFLTLTEGQLQINALEGEAVTADAVIFAGFQWTEGQPSPTPYAFNVMNTLPVNLLPRIVRVSLPGQVTVVSEAALYSETRTNSRIIEELLPTALLNVYGADITGQWRHVRTASGATGWVPAEALQGSLDVTLPAYEATPQLLTRPFGPVWGHGNTGFGQVNLRTGPGESEGILAILPPETPFAVLGRSAALDWLYIQLDAPLEDIREGWVFAEVVDVEAGLDLGELPLAP